MRTAFRNGYVYDEGRFFRADLEVVAGRIVDRALPGESDSEAPVGEVVDLQGAFVIPGLIDAHAHLVLSSDSARDEPLTARVLKGVRNANTQLRAGVTSVRDVGGPGRIAIELKDAIEGGLIHGPRVSTSGSFVCAVDGHVSYWGCEATGTAEVRNAVDTQLKAGSDFIKIMASGGVADEREDPESAQFTLAELEAITQEAAGSGRYVAAHAHPPQAIRLCLEAGVRTIEHASFMDERCIELALERDAFIVPTFIVYDVIAASQKLPKGQRDLAARVLERKIESFLKAAAAGVRWGVGTDAGTFMPHGQLWKEMRFISQLGVPTSRILDAATLTNAEIMHRSDVGRLEFGDWADMVVLNSDPTQHLEALERPAMVIKGGRVVHRDSKLPPPPTTASQKEEHE